MRSYSRLYAILPDNILYANHYKITDTSKRIIFPAENGLRPLKPARLGQSTADAANALYANPNATFPVVFDSLDEATSYAKKHIKKGKSEVTDIEYEITTKTPYYQPAIVEIYIEDEKEAKSGKHLTTHPASYFMRRTWIQSNGGNLYTDLNKKNEGYEEIFSRSKDVVGKIAHLFHDYSHSLWHPRRSKKQVANQIVSELSNIRNKRGTTEKEKIQAAYHCLFQHRKGLIAAKNHTRPELKPKTELNMQGSMMRRLNAALELLIDNGAIPANTVTAKPTAAPERKR